MRKTVKNTEKTAAKKPAAVKKDVTAADVKEVTKAVEEKAEAVVKETAKVVEEVKEEAKKAVKAAAAKAPVKKETVKETVYLQYLGKEINKDDLMKTVKEIWTKQMKKKVGDMKSVSLYLKPEENMAYYVINEDVTGSIDL